MYLDNVAHILVGLSPEWCMVVGTLCDQAASDRCLPDLKKWMKTLSFYATMILLLTNLRPAVDSKSLNVPSISPTLFNLNPSCI